MGSFEVDMEMYDGPEYRPAEKLQEGGGVYLNERIYLQLSMFDPMQRNEIVLSVQDLFSTFFLTPSYSSNLSAAAYCSFTNVSPCRNQESHAMPLILQISPR